MPYIKEQEYRDMMIYMEKLHISLKKGAREEIKLKKENEELKKENERLKEREEETADYDYFVEYYDKTYKFHIK